MDLPADFWSIIGGKMTPTEWAKACGTSRASFAMRWLVVVAELRNRRARHRHLCLRQLQLDRWPVCHSLYLNLWWLGKDVRPYAAQMEKLSKASKVLPSLQCLHLIGRDQVTLAESSFEGILVRLLARHALVLTLQVKAVKMPLDFLPNLRHLVLDLDASSTRQGYRQTHGYLFRAVSMLKSLKTLYVQSAQGTLGGTVAIDGGADMTACTSLRHVAMRDVELMGDLALPDGCLLHAINTARLPSNFAPRFPSLHWGINATYITPSARQGQLSDSLLAALVFVLFAEP